MRAAPGRGGCRWWGLWGMAAAGRVPGGAGARFPPAPGSLVPGPWCRVVCDRLSCRPFFGQGSEPSWRPISGQKSARIRPVNSFRNHGFGGWPSRYDPPGVRGPSRSVGRDMGPPPPDRFLTALPLRSVCAGRAGKQMTVPMSVQENIIRTRLPGSPGAGDRRRPGVSRTSVASTPSSRTSPRHRRRPWPGPGPRC